MEETTRTCPSCGRTLGPLAARCFYCGPAVADPVPAAPPPAAPAPGPAATATAPAAPDPNTHCPICKNAIPAVEGPTFSCPACQSRLEVLFVSPVPLTVGMSRNPTLTELCINHPEVRAAARCRSCRKAVCDTCVFRGPTGSYCPDCAVKPDETARKSTTAKGVWSLVCGVASLLLFAVMMFAAAAMGGGKEAEAMANVLGFIVLGLCLAGVGLGFASRDKARKQSLAGLFGLILNFFVLGIYVLLIFYGIFGVEE